MSAPHSRVFVAAGGTLAAWLMPAVALSASPDAEIAVRFLSAEGALLADDYEIDAQASTFFVVHGFGNRGTGPASLRQASAIRQRFPGANVIIVDWHVPRPPRPARAQITIRELEFLLELLAQVLAVDADYCRAAEAAEEVGGRIAEWMKAKGVSPSRTAISGHSLGAQVAAFAAGACARPELFGERPAAILAADPAGPQFEDKPPEGRLDKDDAVEVVVVHATEALGDENPIGTVDVYVCWPESGESNNIHRHCRARELVTASFLRPEMSNTDGTPFGANALGFDFGDGMSREYQPGPEPAGDFVPVVLEGVRR